MRNTLGRPGIDPTARRCVTIVRLQVSGQAHNVKATNVSIIPRYCLSMIGMCEIHLINECKVSESIVGVLKILDIVRI